jgi:hypothetical protein
MLGRTLRTIVADSRTCSTQQHASEQRVLSDPNWFGRLKQLIEDSDAKLISILPPELVRVHLSSLAAPDSRVPNPVAFFSRTGESHLQNKSCSFVIRSISLNRTTHLLITTGQLACQLR